MGWVDGCLRGVVSAHPPAQPRAGENVPDMEDQGHHSAAVLASEEDVRRLQGAAAQPQGALAAGPQDGNPAAVPGALF